MGGREEEGRRPALENKNDLAHPFRLPSFDIHPLPPPFPRRFLPFFARWHPSSLLVHSQSLLSSIQKALRSSRLSPNSRRATVSSTPNPTKAATDGEPTLVPVAFELFSRPGLAISMQNLRQNAHDPVLEHLLFPSRSRPLPRHSPSPTKGCSTQRSAESSLRNSGSHIRTLPRGGQGVLSRRQGFALRRTNVTVPSRVEQGWFGFGVQHDGVLGLFWE